MNPYIVVFFPLRLLLPEDFTVYSYAKDGSLVTERTNMMVSQQTLTKTE